MREILFRGKRANNGTWLLGDCRHWRPDRIGIHDYNLHHTIEIITETLGQYTGLKDKNGKRIFEGDIFQCKDARGYVCFGTYPSAYESRETHVGFYIKWIIDTMLRIDLAFWANEREIEVVGNIHDNPEMLEVQHA